MEEGLEAGGRDSSTTKLEEGGGDQDTASDRKACPPRWPPVLATTKGDMGLWPTFKDNIRAALTVALISISLSIALGIASGTTPVVGLSTAVWGGVVGGLFGSSRFNVIGPAGALTGMLMSYSTKWTPDILPWIAIFSAVVLAICYVLKLQNYMLFMPKAVFEGFTLGVAVIIGFGQLNFALGLHPAHKHAEFIENLVESFKELPNADYQSYSLFIPLTILLYVLAKYVPKVPWMTVLPVATIILGYITDAQHVAWQLPTLKTTYGALPANVVVLPKIAALAAVPAGEIPELVVGGISVAFVSILETLISAEIAAFRAVAKGLQHNIKVDSSVETRMLGLSHLVCGLFGALPPTGVFVRTNINLDLGATHLLSQFMNALCVLVVTVVAMPLFAFLPMPSIAAVLIVASLRMAPIGYLAELWKHARTQFWLCLVTAVLCVAQDPVVGLVVGMMLALLLHARHNTLSKDAQVFMLSVDEHRCRIVLKGSVTFVNASIIIDRAGDPAAEGIPSSTMHFVVDVTHVTQVDVDGLEALCKLGYKLMYRGGKTRVDYFGRHGKHMHCDIADKALQHKLLTLFDTPKEQGHVRVVHGDEQSQLDRLFVDRDSDVDELTEQSQLDRDSDVDEPTEQDKTPEQASHTLPVM